MDKKNHKTDKKQSLICLDSLTVSVITSKKIRKTHENERIKINQNCEIVSTHRSNQMFANIFDVFYEGIKVGTLETNPKLGKLDENYSRFRYDNQILYTDSISKIYNRLKYAFSWHFQKFSEVDIAMDTEHQNNTFNLFDQYARKTIKILGNYDKSAMWDKNDEMKYFRIGSKKSDKFVRCYYKRQEIAKSNKTYITDYFDKNDFAQDKEVFRVELSMSSKIMNKIYMPENYTCELDRETGVLKTNYIYPFMDESTIYRIEDPIFLASVFNSEVSDKIKYVRTNELKKKGRTNRCKQFNMFKFKISESVVKLKRIKNEVNKFIYRAKVSAKLMYEAFLESGSKVYDKMSDEFLFNAGLYGYKDKMEPIWRDEYKKRKQNKMYIKFLSKLNDFVVMEKKDLKFIQSRL